MLQRLRNRAQGQEGFTLIELLVVILIIGILAAVAIPVFLNQTGKANDANVKSDINSAQTAIETYYTDNQTYALPSSSPMDSLTAIDPSLKNAVNSSTEQLNVPSSSATGYTITANDPANIQFELADSSGTVTRSCTLPNATTNPGGCKITGTVSASNLSGTW